MWQPGRLRRGRERGRGRGRGRGRDGTTFQKALSKRSHKTVIQS